MAEADAKAAIAALKDAGLIRTNKADWRLVAAAQAMLRGEHPDEFAAAAAMGKPIKQRREVSNWLDKLRELERMRASLRSQPGGSGSAAGSSLLAQVGSSLLTQPCWIDEHAPGVQQLRVSAPVISPGKQHATRSLSAVVTTPLGSKRPASATVDYTLPPDGEPASASKRRGDRHRKREERAIRSMDFSEAAQTHAWVRLPVDAPPYGLSAELLLSSAWITRHLTLIEPGSLVVGELQLVDELTAFREIHVTVDDAHFRPLCGFPGYLYPNVGDLDDYLKNPVAPDGEKWPSSMLESNCCGAPVQLMTITSDVNGVGQSTDAVMAAWLRHDFESDGWDHVAWDLVGRHQVSGAVAMGRVPETSYEYLAKFYDDFYGDRATLRQDQAIISTLPASKTCDQCGGDVPDVAVRWRCDACDFDCCLACGTSQQEDGLSTAVGYDLPPAAGESQAESNRRRERHRKREEAAIRDLRRWCVGGRVCA